MSLVTDRRKRGWFWADDVVLTDNGASAIAKLTYIALAKYADAAGRCFPAIQTLAVATSLSRSSVKRALLELAALEPPRIRIREGGGRGEANLYELLGWPKADSEEGGQFTENRPPGDGSHRPNPQDADAGRSTVDRGQFTEDRGAALYEPGGGSQRTTEGIPKEGIPKEQENQRALSARDGFVVIADREGKQHELRWPSGKTLIALYNARRPAHWPEAETVGGTRLEKANRYVRMFPEITWWRRVFDEAHESPFLSGKTKPGAGHEHFTPDFDWLTSKGQKDQVENCLKVHDRKYRRKIAPSSLTGPSSPRLPIQPTADDEAAIREAQASLPWRSRSPARTAHPVDEARDHHELQSAAREQARSIGA